MRATEFLTEAKLTPTHLYKRDNVSVFLKKVEMLSPFQTVDGDDVLIDPNEYDKIADFFLNKRSGTLQVYDLNSKKMIPTGKLAKTTEFGGSTAATTGDKAGEMGKESYQVKPSQVLGSQIYDVNTLGQTIINSSVLKQDGAGIHVIEMAKQIVSGMPCQMPKGPDVTKAITTTINDYAGEYLGILALIKGSANFPTLDQFLRHLGVDSIGNLQISFPQKSNSPLADSIGKFISAEGNEILISSKGNKGGAAPSITGLKVPEEFRNKRAYQMEIAFIDICQNAAINAKALPFYLSNFLHDNEKMPKWMPKFTDEDIALALKLVGPKYTGHFTDGLNDNLMSVVNNVKWGKALSKEAQPGLVASYAVEKTVVDVVNNTNALPQFENLAREILQKNFIQINADIVKGVLQFSVIWPNKNMATGKILLATKNGTGKNVGKLSFKIK